MKTTCCYCGVGCGILVHRDSRGRVSVTGDPDHPVNRGMLCSKGLNLHHTANDTSDRLTSPQVRDTKGEALRETGWDQALDRVAEGFRRAIADHGPDSVAFYVSGQCLTEEYFLLNKVMKGFIGSNNIDTNSRLCMSSAVAGYKQTLGEDSVPGCYDDLEAADCWLVAGANPAWCHPILFRRLEARRARADRGWLIVVDPRRTQTAEGADLHLALRPGTDVALFQGLARLLWEGGWADEGFLARSVEGVEEFRAQVFSATTAWTAAFCGLAEDDLRTAARWIGEAKGFVSLWAMGLNQSTQGTDKNTALIALHLVTGRIGTPGNAPFSLTGQPNAMGGREVGGLANLLPAHRTLTNPADRAEVARLWGSPALSDRPGLTATELVDAMAEGRLKALWVVCTNPLVSLPDLNQVEQAFRTCPLVVVQDVSSRSDTLAFADVVLPAATWLEKEGTMTNSERRISYLNRVLDPPGQALADTEILRRFAVKMGWGAAFEAASPATLFAEHTALTAGTALDISGLDHDRLREAGTFQWPVPTAASAGTARLFTDGRFPRPSGRARLVTSAVRAPEPAPTAEFPLVLTSGRVRDQWHTMTRSGKVNKLGRHEPEAFLEVHPEDAARYGLTDGALAEVTSPRGQALVRARVTDAIRPGVVFLPMHWGRLSGQTGARANNLTEARPDPVSKEPDLKYQTVRVLPRKPFPGRVVVVGAGVAAAAFLRAWREDNPRGPVTVLSAEDDPFYNRTQLPHYVEGTKAWESLVSLGSREAGAFGWTVHSGRRAVALDRARNAVVDHRGRGHRYDLLVIATGSGALVPPVPGAGLGGVQGLRTRADADRLVSRCAAGGPVVVVGGGLLALEAAGALHSRGVPVTLVHRSRRLMDKQLDETAGRLLLRMVIQTGLDLALDEEVERLEGSPGGEVAAVVLKSGRRLDAGTVIFATGTRPHTGWLEESGLLGSQAVEVDDRMATADPAILALGEVAQWRGQVAGITPAAEAQGRVAARAASGDPFAVYRGTPAVNVLKWGDLALAAVGRAKEVGPGQEAVVFLDEAQGVYKKVVVEDDRVVGALLVGDKGDFASLKDLIDSGEELGPKRSTLLRSGAPTVAGTGRVVCSCLGVRESVLRAAGSVPGATVASVSAATGAGTGCGSCRPELAAFVDVQGSTTLPVPRVTE